MLAVLALASLAYACDTNGEATGGDAENTPVVSGLYGPCGMEGFACATGLACVPSRANPAVFLCTMGCTPAPKCPGVLAVGGCKPLNACEEGCCMVTNLWYDPDTPLLCDGAEVASVHSDGFCQPWP